MHYSEQLMSNTEAISPDPTDRGTPGASRVLPVVLLAAILCLLPGFAVLPKDWNIGLVAAGLSLLVTTAVCCAKTRFQNRFRKRALALSAKLIENEDCACIIADKRGYIQAANARFTARFQIASKTRLDECLKSQFANPSAIALRLQSLAQMQGTAQDTIVARGGETHVSVTRLEEDLFCWRFLLDQKQFWEGMLAPVITVGRNDVVLNINAPARELLGNTPMMLADILVAGPSADADSVHIQTPSGVQSASVVMLRKSGVTRDLMLLQNMSDQVAEPGASFDDLPVPIMRLSPEGRILEANRLATQMVGDVLQGNTSIQDLMQGLGQPVQTWLKDTVERGSTPRSEILRLTRKDQDVFVQVTLSKMLRDGQVCLIAVLNDATELKTLEAQFVQGQKMQAVGQLAGGVAHDFNNLLTAISGHCDLLLLRHDQNDPNYGDLVQINQNANRAAALVSQLLAFSRKQTLRPEVLDLRETISDLIHLLNRLVGEKVRLILSHDPVVKPVRADKRQLEQVLMNLVVNARDAMPEGGEIRIETEILRLDQPMVRDRATVQPGEYVTVKVIDSGTGIAADKLQKIFEPFYTTKRTGEGTGLGLSTVYGIVKQTGGFIFVDSVLGRGSEFTVFLPVCQQKERVEPQAISAPIEKISHQGEGVVLLVEDEAPVRAFATRALRLKGFTVLEAESAEDALALLEDDDLNVDIFVTDVVMPSIDGPTWVRQAMEKRPDVRVVFMSGYTEGAFDDSGPDIANSTFLPKPFSLNQLTEAVFQQLN